MLWQGGSGRPLLFQATDLGVQIAVMALCSHWVLARVRGQEQARLSRMAARVALSSLKRRTWASSAG
jgi:predicted lysophospholipase L1 biosynthesis ABC-type transport system permease subunit